MSGHKFGSSDMFSDQVTVLGLKALLGESLLCMIEPPIYIGLRSGPGPISIPGFQAHYSSLCTEILRCLFDIRQLIDQGEMNIHITMPVWSTSTCTTEGH